MAAMKSTTTFEGTGRLRASDLRELVQSITDVPDDAEVVEITQYLAQDQRDESHWFIRLEWSGPMKKPTVYRGGIDMRDTLGGREGPYAPGTH